MDETLDLAALHAAHMQTMRGRFDRALSACGHSGVIVYSGALAPIFRDDQTHPFRVHAWFKAWVPLVDAPDLPSVRGEQQTQSEVVRRRDFRDRGTGPVVGEHGHRLGGGTGTRY